MNTKHIILIALCMLLAYIIYNIIIIYIDWNTHSHLHSQSDPVIEELKYIFNDFFSKKNQWTEPLESLNKRDIMNDINIYRGAHSYNINKRKIYICIKDKDNQYYPMNTLIYVLAHEIAHSICSDEIGHTEKFHTIFDALLDELEKEKIYDSKRDIEEDYCIHGDAV